MKKHIMIGSLICVATVLIFLVFWGKLPSDEAEIRGHSL